MKQVFFWVRVKLTRLLAYMLVHAAKSVIAKYDANKDGLLQPKEYLPLVQVVNLINVMVRKD